MVVLIFKGHPGAFILLCRN